eukprot:Opistho-1_new@90079
MRGRDRIRGDKRLELALLLLHALVRDGREGGPRRGQVRGRVEGIPARAHHRRVHPGKLVGRIFRHDRRLARTAQSTPKGIRDGRHAGVARHSKGLTQCRKKGLALMQATIEVEVNGDIQSGVIAGKGACIHHRERRMIRKPRGRHAHLRRVRTGSHHGAGRARGRRVDRRRHAERAAANGTAAVLDLEVLVERTLGRVAAAARRDRAHVRAAELGVRPPAALLALRVRSIDARVRHNAVVVLAGIGRVGRRRRDPAVRVLERPLVRGTHNGRGRRGRRGGSSGRRCRCSMRVGHCVDRGRGLFRPTKASLKRKLLLLKRRLLPQNELQLEPHAPAFVKIVDARIPL